MIKRMLLTILTTIFSLGLLLYLGVCVLLYFIQEQLIYYPSYRIEATPADIDLVYEDIRLTTSDEVEVAGWFIPNENANSTVLFFHGNAGNISHRLQSIEMFHNFGLNVFIIDYRGYGRSGGEASEQGTYLDAEAAWSYLTDEHGISPEKIIIFGRSLGGGVATWLAQQKSPQALILESTFASVPDVAATHYPYLPVRLLARIHYNSLSRMKDITCPVLIIHSPDDKLIPYRNGQRLFEAANTPKEFIEIKGGHNEVFIASLEVYQTGVQAFLERYD